MRKLIIFKNRKTNYYNQNCGFSAELENHKNFVFKVDKKIELMKNIIKNRKIDIFKFKNSLRYCNFLPNFENNKNYGFKEHYKIYKMREYL